MIRKEKKDRHSTMTKIRKRSKRQTIIYKTLHRKPKIKRREIPLPPKKTGLSFPALQVTPVVLLLDDTILIWYDTCILFGEISIFLCQSYGTLFIKLEAIFRMSRCKLRTLWPIHFKFCTFIGIDSLKVCILCGEISIFHSRVIGKKVFTNIVWMLKVP
jgi:hypothetical protein